MNRQNVLQQWPEEGVYALASSPIEEEGGLRRKGFFFEVVPAQVVRPFLQQDDALLNEGIDTRLKTALQAWLERKPEDGRFHQAKLPLLGAPENIGVLRVWFDDDALADEIEVQSWYFAAAGQEYDCALELPRDTLAADTHCTLQPLEEAVREVLDELYLVKDFGDTVRSGVHPLSQVGANTQFYSAELFYVGAALCVGLREALWDNQNQVWTRGNFEAFFDLGCASGQLSNNLAVVRASVRAIRNVAYIQQILQNYPNQIIVFSHLHDDHISICHYLDANQYAQLFQQAVWYAPEGVSVIFLGLQEKIVSAGGTLNILNNLNPAQPQTVLLHGNPNFHMGKIDAFSGQTSAERNPHHHGIYVRLNLVSGNTVLLVGDCTYAGIPANEKQGITYLQASHHGGNYALAPVPRVGRAQAIPQPVAAPPNNQLICSANGYTYHHPSPVYLGEHYRQGWSNPAFVLVDAWTGRFECT